MGEANLRTVTAEVGGRILSGELVRLNGKTAIIRFSPVRKKPFTIKRHLEKHQVKFMDVGN